MLDSTFDPLNNLFHVLGSGNRTQSEYMFESLEISVYRLAARSHCFETAPLIASQRLPGKFQKESLMSGHAMNLEVGAAPEVVTHFWLECDVKAIAADPTGESQDSIRMNAFVRNPEIAQYPVHVRTFTNSAQVGDPLHKIGAKTRPG